MKFSDFYNNHGITKTDKSEEQLFLEVVSVKIPSVNSFIAWLVLNRQIKPYMKESNSKPIPLFNLPAARKINHIVKSVPMIKELAREFAFKFKTPDYIRD
jgi:hypothetical protein